MIIKSFIFTGIVCVIAQIIKDNTKLTSGHITSLFVSIGGLLGFLGIYDKLVKFFGGGASVVIMSFGNTLYNGNAVNEIASKPYVLVKVAETSGVTKYQNGYAKTVKGKATITGFTFVDSIYKATKFATDSSGNIEIYNLLTATTGREGDFAVDGFEYIDQAEFQYQ